MIGKNGMILKKVVKMDSESAKIEVHTAQHISKILSQKVADYARKGLDGAANTKRAYQTDLTYY